MTHAAKLRYKNQYTSKNQSLLTCNTVKAENRDRIIGHQVEQQDGFVMPTSSKVSSIDLNWSISGRNFALI